MQKVIKALRWANLLLILTTFLAYLSPYVHPGTFGIFSFFGVAYPWLLLCNLLFVFFWLLRKDRYLLFSLICIIMGWGHFTRFVGINFGSGEVGANYTTVISYNIQYLSSLRTGTNQARTAKTAAFHQLLKEQQPHIFCVQEAGSINIEFLNDALPLLHHYSVEGKGTAIYSTYPIINQGVVEFGTKVNACLWADVKVDQSIYRIYSIHLQSNKVSRLADQVIQDGDLQRRQTWTDIGGMISRVKKATVIRAQQAELVAAHIAQSPHPVIVCGDLNDTPQSYSYRQIARNLPGWILSER